MKYIGIFLYYADIHIYGYNVIVWQLKFFANGVLFEKIIFLYNIFNFLMHEAILIKRNFQSGLMCLADKNQKY